MAQVEFQVPGPGTYIIEAAPSLPPLSQPGTAADVLTGEQFYGEDGNLSRARCRITPPRP